MADSDWLNNLAASLAANGFGTVGTNIFKGQLPIDFPATTLAVLLIPTQGRQADKQHELEFPRVQITCRHADFSSAWTQANAIYRFLDWKVPFSQGSGPTGTAFFDIRALQAPFSLGPDERSAWRIVSNYQLDILST